MDKNYQIIDQLTFEVYNTRYISYNEVNHYFEKLYEFLDENVKDMIERKEYNYAFQLINHIVSKVDEAIMYSDGDECLLIDLIDELWKELIKDANNEDKEEMYYWFADHLEDYEYLEDKIKEIFLNEFYGEIFHDSQLYVIKQQFELFKNQFLCLYQNTHVNVWLEDYFQNDKYVKRYYKENKNNYSQVLNYVCHALNKLPIYQNEYQLLAIFAQQITKDPHYFDEDLAKELLIKGICKILEVENSSINQILYEAGILKDDLSNYCYICHIKPKIIRDYDCFYEKYEPINLNLYNLNSIGRKFVESKIVIIENPSVFRELMIEIKEKKLNIGLICSNGQINQCTYQLIDSLIESQCILYYCGDFDPEGLLIADKLKQKYNGQIYLWQYSAAHFEKAKIHQVVISQRRQTILKNIQNSLLKEIALKIQSTSAFAYQEGMIDIYKDNLANL